jgi:hypothetical protein
MLHFKSFLIVILVLPIKIGSKSDHSRMMGSAQGCALARWQKLRVNPAQIV